MHTYCEGQLSYIMASTESHGSEFVCKLSNVTPVYKKEDETSKSNYRPISVLSTIPNVFEKLKFDQLYRHFSPLFSDNMSGFLHGHSCCTALLKLTGLASSPGLEKGCRGDCN